MGTERENTKRQIFYRGLIKSCNYSCGYCPFSKHISKRELEMDKKELERFVACMEQNPLNVGAVQIVPYGEALIHEYYWEAMAALSRIPELEQIGCQTNLSFPVKRMLAVFEKAGGCREKLRLWCTFHPTMVSVEDFLEQCSLLEEEKVAYCVGSVGVPEQEKVLAQLRAELSPSVYMWVNPMDGLGRAYTQEEIADFEKIDAFFPYLLKHKKAQPQQCKGCLGEALFVHSNGDVTPCNISRKKLGNIYQELSFWNHQQTIKNCGQKECSCFLAYSNRLDCPELICYGKYPAFRMAKPPKAMFLDVDGTLVKEGSDTIEEPVAAQIAHWGRYSQIYLATSLPLAHAMKKCSSIKQWLSGGVFANGGMVCLFKEKENWMIPIESDKLDLVQQLLKEFSMKVKAYSHNGEVYKITGMGKQAAQVKKVLQERIEAYGKEGELTIIVEGDYLEITGQQADKLAGVLSICRHCGYQRDEVLVAGDSENDAAMLGYFPMSIVENQMEKIHAN